MEFGWINFFGVAIIGIMMVPNAIFALRNKNNTNHCKNKLINGAEQIGRYACIVLMWLPLGVWKFGFCSVAEMLIYLIGNSALLLLYLIVWVFYFKGQSLGKAMILAIIPTVIFLMSGLLLRHWLLVLAAVMFAVGHICITYGNNKETTNFKEKTEI